MTGLHYTTGDATRPQGARASSSTFAATSVAGAKASCLPSCAAGSSPRRAIARGGSATRISLSSWASTAFALGAACRRFATRRCARDSIASRRSREQGATARLPRIGAGLAAANWGTIEAIIAEESCDQGIEVTLYDLPQSMSPDAEPEEGR